MNKETRTFIFGLIMFLICSLGTSIHFVAILNDTWKCDTHNVLLLTGCIMGAILGAIKVSNTTN